jgi:hypothetical protein
MGVEGCHFEGCGLRQAQFIAKGPQMSRRDIVVAILNQVEIFNEEVVTPGAVAQQLSNLLKRGEVELPSLGKTPCALSGSDMSCWPVRPTIHRGFLCHAYFPFLSGNLNSFKLGVTSLRHSAASREEQPTYDLRAATIEKAERPIEKSDRSASARRCE